jgi:hypothetical protein
MFINESKLESKAIVFALDDDASMRESLENLIRSVGLRVEASPIHIWATEGITC